MDVSPNRLERPVIALVPFVATVGMGGRPTRRPFGYDLSAHSALHLGNLSLVEYADTVDDPRVVKIAESVEELVSVTGRSVLSGFLRDRAITGGTIREAIVDVLRTPSTHPAVQTWHALTPSKPAPWCPRWSYRIWFGLGQTLLWESAVAPWENTQSYIDTFNRADGALNGSSLSGGTGTWTCGTEWAVASNQAVMTGSGIDAQAYVGECDTDSAFAEIEFIASNTTGTFRGFSVTVLRNTTGTNFLVFYLAENSGTFALEGTVGGSYGTTSGTMAANDTLKIIKNGSEAAGYKNSTLLLGPYTVTGESTGAGNRYVAFGAYSFSGGTQVYTVDNFAGGDYVPPAGGYLLTW